MTKSEAIAIITAALPALDDEQTAALAEIAQSMQQPALARPLTDREHALLEQAKQDFAQGRTVTLEESRQRTDALFARYRLQPKAV